MVVGFIPPTSVSEFMGRVTLSVRLSALLRPELKGKAIWFQEWLECSCCEKHTKCTQGSLSLQEGVPHPKLSAEICRIMSHRKLGRICRIVIPQTVRGLAQTDSLVSPVTPHLPGWDKLPSRVTATLKMLRKWSSQGAIPAHLPMLRAQIIG